MLDSVFIMPPTFGANSDTRGSLVHEMREMQVIDMGQYAHGNQPIQHMIYLYNYAGEPWKTQYWIREVLTRLYTPAPDGIAVMRTWSDIGRVCFFCFRVLFCLSGIGSICFRCTFV